MISGYSPPAIIVPTASEAVWPVSQVSLTLAPVISAIFCCTTLSSLISVPGTAKNAVYSLIPPSSPAEDVPVLPSLLPPPPQPASIPAAKTDVIRIAVNFFNFIFFPPSFLYKIVLFYDYILHFFVHFHNQTNHVFYPDKLYVFFPGFFSEF